MSARKAFLALADGTLFEGRPLGAEGETTGEVVFNTGLSGYQEILTDPSYKGQLVTMTYPHIGNTGVNQEDVESFRPHVNGFIVREACPHPSSWRSRQSLQEYLVEHGISGIQGIDTRELTRHIRSAGCQMAVIAHGDHSARELVERAARLPGIEGRDLVREVTCKKPYRWTQGVWRLSGGYPDFGRSGGCWGDNPQRVRVVAYDFGVKYNILRLLVEAGCDPWVVPALTPASEVAALRPQGLFLSNGPGDPAALPYAIRATKQLIGEGIPTLGICLGHQILGLALGGRTYKLRFGHHGINHPVRDEKTRRVDITSQNHNFCVDVGSLPARARVTHVHQNDRTVEGFELGELPVFCVQHHPEASPGPHDARYLFERFVRMVRERSPIRN